ncbi:Oxygen-independent coproporphyrinogen-III oxidase [compost metagenome]
MCYGRIDFDRFQAAHGICFNDYFAEALEQLAEQVDDQLLALDQHALQLLPQGHLMMRNTAMAFDAYLGGGRKGQFSRTV